MSAHVPAGIQALHSANLHCRGPIYRSLKTMSIYGLINSFEFLNYVNSQIMSGIRGGFHLAWMGGTIKLTKRRWIRLIVKSSAYLRHERLEVIGIKDEALAACSAGKGSGRKMGNLAPKASYHAVAGLNSMQYALGVVPIPELHIFRVGRPG